MSQRKEIVIVCDMCFGAASVEKRTIQLIRRGEPRQASFHACRACRDSVPLANWERRVSPVKTGGRSLTHRPVLTQAEVDAMAAYR